MIRKFAAVPGSRAVLAVMFVTTILAGAATVHAQQDSAQQPSQQPPAQQAPAQQPAAQPPDNPQSTTQQTGSQEATPEEAQRRVKRHDYKNWVFNVGAGASLTSGATKTNVRGGGVVAAGGVARNYSKNFGLRLDVQWDNLPLRDSALRLAQAPGATSQVYSVLLDPVVNFEVTKESGAYVLGGPAYFHRSGKLDSSTAIPGAPCNSFWTWWGGCYAGSIPLSGDFIHSSENEFGENFGAGITRKIRPNMEVYVEFRLLHGSHDRITTDLRPITIGVRW